MQQGSLWGSSICVACKGNEGKTEFCSLPPTPMRVSASSWLSGSQLWLYIKIAREKLLKLLPRPIKSEPQRAGTHTTKGIKLLRWLKCAAKVESHGDGWSVFFRQPNAGGTQTLLSLSSSHPSALALWPHGSGCQSLCVHITFLNSVIFGCTLEVIQDSK